MGPFMKALQYRQEGGTITPAPVTPAVAPVGADTGIPQGGNAATPINQYLTGTTPAPAGGVGGLSYTPGAVASAQNQRIEGQRVIKDALLGGDITQEQARGLSDQVREEQTWQQDPRLRDYATGQKNLGLYTGDFKAEGPMVPGMSGVAANAIGQFNYDYQQKMAEKYGPGGSITLASPDGQPVTVHKGPGGGWVVSGNKGGLPDSVYFDAARKQGLRQDANAPLNKGVGWITDKVQGYTDSNEAAAMRAVQQREAAAEAARRAQVNARSQEERQADVSRAQRTDAWSGMSAPRQASYEAAVERHGFNVGGRNAGGMIYAQGGQYIDEDPWAPKGVARTNVQTAPLAQASRVATPAGMAPQGPGVKEQLGALAGKTLANKFLGGGFMGQAAGIIGGFNEGGEIMYKNFGGPLGGGQRPEALKEAFQLGALTREEYLKAMEHAGGYKNMGGRMGADMYGSPAVYRGGGGPLSGHRGPGGNWMSGVNHPGPGPDYLNKGGPMINPANKGKFSAKAKAAGEGTQEYARKVLAAPEGRYDPATRKQANFARNAAAWHKADGGMVGPLAKTVHKTKDGESYEINYHNPMKEKNKGGE